MASRPRPGGKRGKNYFVGTYDRNGNLDLNPMTAAGSATAAKYNFLDSMGMLSGGKNDYTKGALSSRSSRSEKQKIESTK